MPFCQPGVPCLHPSTILLVMVGLGVALPALAIFFGNRKEKKPYQGRSMFSEPEGGWR